MIRRVTQREFRNESDRIMPALEGRRLHRYAYGVPVGELVPVKARVFVAAELVLAASKATRNPTDFASLSALLEVVAV